MIIWTMQPKAEFERQIRETGVCHEITYLDEQTEFPKAYDFLTEEMKKRVGPAPSGVRYPAWGYQMWEPKRPRPDIRWLRWNWGPSDMEHVRVELDVPDDQVLLLDDYAFPMRLNDWLISDSEAECDSGGEFLISRRAVIPIGAEKVNPLQPAYGRSGRNGSGRLIRFTAVPASLIRW